MLFLAFWLYVLGFGAILFDASLREAYSLKLAVFAGVLIALALLSFVAGLLKRDRLSRDPAQGSLP